VKLIAGRKFMVLLFLYISRIIHHIISHNPPHSLAPLTSYRRPTEWCIVIGGNSRDGAPSSMRSAMMHICWLRSSRDIRCFFATFIIPLALVSFVLRVLLRIYYSCSTTAPLFFLFCHCSLSLKQVTVARR
jgi:hypothetical protein